MITIDLITGFLGSGKTTFIRSYANFLKKQGENICILENDHGAINVDALLLRDLEDDQCDVEMIVGGDGEEAHRRRFRTKLISFGMLGYTRVIVEPSGIYDLDEFFDSLQEEPLNRWYRIGNMISLVDARIRINQLSPAARDLLASEAAVGGKIILTHTDQATVSVKKMEKDLTDLLKEIRCSRDLSGCLLTNPGATWDSGFEDPQFSNQVMQAGYVPAVYEKHFSEEIQQFQSFFYMNLTDSPEEFCRKAKLIFADRSFGTVFRIKGFLPTESGWIKINGIEGEIETEPIAEGQNVVIIIGEGLNKEKIDELWDTGKGLI